MHFQQFGGGGADDLMAAMMGGGGMDAFFGGGGMGRRGPRKGRDVGVRMGVELGDLYNGTVKEFEMEKQSRCTACAGTGTKSGRPCKCQACNGRGVRIVRRMIGPGMVQQMQVPCDECGQTGKSAPDHDRCGPCEGKCFIEEKKKFKVRIRPGMKHGEHIPFKGEGDWSPEIDIPGDIVFVLEQQKHDEYEVKGTDLIITKTITLVQALTGFELEHTHMDGRKLVLCGQRGRVMTPGTLQVVPGEGMPSARGDHGDLIVKFALEFPRMLDEDQVEKLKVALPGGPKKGSQCEDFEECFMDDYTPEQWKQMGAIGEDEEEDQEESGGGGVRCAHQ